MRTTSVDKVLELARKQREQGDSVAALDNFNKALLLAQKDKNYERLVQCFVDRAIAFRHMFEETGDMTFAILARKDAETVLELVKAWGISERLHTAYYMLGQAALLFKDYAIAENYFFKSLRYFKGNPAEKASWRYHWAKALYEIGEKKKALLAFSQAITDIKKYAKDVDKFLFNVYLSGAYINFACVLIKDNKEEAKKYFNLAGEIIKSDKRLVVRKKQFKELEKKFAKH
jgi:tetratricopeptide (TPR) repeat protein